MTLRALIWDVDGTLAETERDGHLPAFNRAFADDGLPWHWDASRYGELLRITGGKERIAHWWRALDPVAAAAPDAAARIQRLHARKTAHYAQAVRQGAVQLRPGVRRVLVEARLRGLTLAIATTTHEANVRELIDATLGPSARGWFSAVGAGDVVPRKKPAPDIYRWVLEQLRLPAHDALAIEDSAVGVAAAQGAGLPVLLTRSLYTAGDTVGEVLADLDGLGSHDAPAAGVAGGESWRGLVDVGQLECWHAARPSPLPSPARA
jgi:beta-phosphoglucomutase-like phosphatase (HAD superfamily)